MTANQNIHQGQPLVVMGSPLDEAKAVMIMVHGRGASPRNILSLANNFHTDGFAYLAPQATGNTWYPHSFLAPLDANEPGISSGIQAIADVIKQVEGAGISAEKIMLLGFSQGACLSLEFAARNAKRYGGVVALSGGLIGPDDTSRDYEGSLEETPVFLGCSDIDFHIPLQRVHDSEIWLKALNANVDKRIYPNMGHTTNDDEFSAIQAMMVSVVAE